MRKWIRAAAVAAVAVVALSLAGGAGAVGTGAPGYAATAFVTGIQNGGAVGPVGLAFDSSNSLYMQDYNNGVLYKFDAGGGPADAAHALGNTGFGFNNIAGITFSPSGRLYAAVQGSGLVVEISPVDGHYIRTLASLGCATGIATDPLTGDLFATSPCGGATMRISNYESGTLTTSFVPGSNGIDGITIGPDGTLYQAQEPCCGYGTNYVTKIARPTPTTYGPAVVVAAVPQVDGTAISPSLDPNNPYVFGNRNDGIVTKIDTTGASPVLTNIYSGGTRGDFSTVGPDGCLYITQTAEVVKITNADGTCSFIPTSALPQISLAPTTQSDHVGDTATITATLTNVAHPAGTSVTFTVTGANPSSQTVTADASGTVTFSYAAASSRDDQVVATSHIGTLDVTSNTASVHWDPPLDTTPPDIQVDVHGPGGNTGWYLGDTKVTWTVTDPESGIASSNGCDTVTESGFAAGGYSLTCSATNGVGLTNSKTVSFNIDDTLPTVTFTPNGGVYDVDQTIHITCASADTGSGVASDTCSDVNGTGWSLGLGTHPLSATATDVAGNQGGGTGSYTVVASPGGVCALVQQWVSNAGIANSLCVKLLHGSFGAFRNEVSAQRGKALTVAHADTLTALSYTL